MKIFPSRTTAAALLLLAGVLLWATQGQGRLPNAIQLVLVAAWAVLAAMPGPRAWVAAGLNKIRCPSPRQRAVASLVIGLSASVYLLLAALLQDRPLVPKFHDEQMFLVQMQMIARGRLWMPQHPVADSFETFHVFVKPLYAAMQFPGTALMYAPSVWLRLPMWALPVVVAGAIVGLLYRVITGAVDGVAGALGALLILSLPWFRFLSVTVMSQLPMLLLGLIGTCAWLRWSETRQHRWALLLGAAMGWAAVTRPVDAICYALPLGLGLLWVSRGAGLKTRAWTLASLVVAAAPFLALQLWFNRGVTGSILQSPAARYSSQFHPGAFVFSEPPPPNAPPVSNLLQKNLYYKNFVAPDVRAYAAQSLGRLVAGRVGRLIEVDLPTPLLVVLTAVGLLAARSLRRWVMLGVLPLFLVGYALNAAYIEQYGLAVVPAVALLTVLGVGSMAQLCGEHRTAAEVFLGGSLALLCVSSLPPINPHVIDDPLDRPTMVFVAKELPRLVKQPALVLFTFRRGNNEHVEPVYNTDVAWPDDARIIRAHDLRREQNLKLLRYYAQRQPERHVYFFDRTTFRLTYQGQAGEIWEHLSKPPTTTGPVNGGSTTRPASSR